MADTGEGDESVRAGYTCPVCGYPGLAMSPYERLPGPPVPSDAAPPYERDFGAPSYEICPCCGFEFGLEDGPPNPSTAVSFEQYRRAWIEEGAEWFDEASRPEHWSLHKQLIDAGLLEGPLEPRWRIPRDAGRK